MPEITDPFPAEAIKQHLMAVREEVNLHDSESFTAAHEPLWVWKVIATLLPPAPATVAGKRLDDQLIIAILVLICF